MKPKTPLRFFQPPGYIKIVQDTVDASPSNISLVASGRHNSYAIKQALAWNALETMLGKLLN